MHTVDLYNLCYLPNIMRTAKSEKNEMGWAYSSYWKHEKCKRKTFTWKP
jgi:hypothetical protein